MATGNGGGGGGGEDELKQLAELSKTLKEGERILAPTRRPDGTLRKPIRIRAGYVPQEEVAIYQSKGTLWKKQMASQVGPPGYDPTAEAKPKTKSTKRNERKKEKRQQAALEKAKNLENEADEDSTTTSDSVISLTSEMNQLAVSALPSMVSLQFDSVTGPDQVYPGQDMDKRIRSLKKKIRLAEAQLQKSSQHEIKPEHLEKLAKIEGWREELKLLEDEKAEMANS